MSLHRTKELILALRPVAAWPEMVELVERVRSRDVFGIWEYPVVACEAVGGRPDAAEHGAAAILCSLISIHLVDDMLDDDPKGDYHRLGPGAAANLALAFQAAGHRLLDQATLSPQTRAALQAVFSEMSLSTAHGQSLDQRSLRSEEEYWQVVGSKTPPLFAAAFTIGSLLGGAPAEVVDRLSRIGVLLGLGVQVSDDLLDALSTPAASDWSRRPNNLPILYAMTADHPERESFLELSARVAEPEALAAAQGILVRSGALSYCAFKLHEFLGEARSHLASVPLSSPEPVLRLLDAQTAPLQRLFAASGAPETDSLFLQRT